MPVKMKSKIPVGSISAELSTYKIGNEAQEVIAKEVPSENKEFNVE